MTATASARPGSDLARRTASGVVLGAVVFGSIATVPTFAIVVAAMSLGSLYELARLSALDGHRLVVPVAATAIVAYIGLTASGWLAAYERPLLAATILCSIGWSLAGERRGFFARSAFTIFAVLYLGWLPSYFVTLRNLPHAGIVLTAASVAIIAATDVFAMLVGVAFGRTPLTPISPRKTWEGAVGGLCASSLAGSALALVPGLGFHVWDGAFVGAFTSVAAQFGDIVESGLKRDAHVKDAGTFFAGHGGVLDRFDSYTLGGIAFYFALFVTHHIPQ